MTMVLFKVAKGGFSLCIYLLISPLGILLGTCFSGKKHSKVTSFHQRTPGYPPCFFSHNIVSNSGCFCDPGMTPPHDDHSF